MPLSVHILDAHLDKFKEIMAAYSEVQGEWFHKIYLTSHDITKDVITT